jgi:hypothetical protein
MHHTMHTFIDDAGGVHFTDDVDMQGTGFSDTLVSYVASDRQFTIVDMPGPPQTVVQSFISFLRVIRQGETFPMPDDFTLRFQTHFTFNANGVPTATMDTGPTAECR